MARGKRTRCVSARACEIWALVGMVVFDAERSACNWSASTAASSMALLPPWPPMGLNWIYISLEAVSEESGRTLWAASPMVMMRL